VTIRYAEPGSSFWPVLWAPGFALLGLGVEALSGSVHVLGWALAAVVLAGVWALWVVARRRLRSVSLTDEALRLGEEELPVGDIEAVEEDEPEAAKVLGGGWTVPKGTGAVPLRLRDGRIVLAWARRPDELRAALRALLAA
jgi:Protein of unknown function (DUF3093)